jgi:hypothetical protein
MNDMAPCFFDGLLHPRRVALGGRQPRRQYLTQRGPTPERSNSIDIQTTL